MQLLEIRYNLFMQATTGVVSGKFKGHIELGHIL